LGQIYYSGTSGNYKVQTTGAYVHYSIKKPAGDRLGNSVLNHVYGYANPLGSVLSPDNAQLPPGSAKIQLTMKAPADLPALGTALGGFAVCDLTAFHCESVAAQNAVVTGSTTIEIALPSSIVVPGSVRYGWYDYMTTYFDTRDGFASSLDLPAPFYNSEGESNALSGMPAPTFGVNVTVE
jgi:hypothetical protein